MDFISSPSDKHGSILPSPVKQFGSKRGVLAIHDFTQYFPRTSKRDTYIELFSGSGVVAFQYLKHNPPTSVLLNDLNKNLQTFWEWVADPIKRKELEDALKYRWVGSIIEEKTELDTICNWYLNTAQISMHIDRPVLLFKRFDYWTERLDKCSVMYLCKPWQNALKAALANLAKGRVIIYADPPYDGTSGYGFEFNLEEMRNAGCVGSPF